MAEYPTLRYGSTGEEVRKLQEALNAAGSYALALDGIYGEKTKQAVTAYQKANGLGVDGIAGRETLGHLYSTGSSEATKEQATEKAQSPWEKWVNREAFSYDPEQDSLYQQYREQYLNLGRLAMEDTMGKAAALTGGYGNTYAQTAGQQSYEAYMQQLGSILPELYDRAYDRYTAEGEALYKEAVAYENRRQQAYGELEKLVEAGYVPTDEELEAAGMTRQQANAIASAAENAKTTTYRASSGSSGKSSTTQSEVSTDPDAMGLTEEEIKALQRVAGLKVTGKWNESTARAYLDGYRPGSSTRIEAFFETLTPESGHDTIQRKIWGNYRNYLLSHIMASKTLRTAEKDYLIQHYGFTMQERNYVNNHGLVKKAEKLM